MDPGGFALSGTINFADSIKYNYTRLNTFHAEIIFADAQGRVLGSRSLLTAKQIGFDRWEPEKFSQTFALPPGAVAFAFGYTGQVLDSGGGGRRGGGGANPTNIWHSPLSKSGAHQHEKK
jgi:hypothetical protein